MSKFDKPFAEVRLYFPLESNTWEALQATSIADLFTQSGKLAVFETNVKKKGRNKDGK